MRESPDIIIRRVLPGDQQLLRNLARETFLDTFGEHNTLSDMQLYLDENLSLQKLAAELGQEGSEFYFAELNNEPIAYLKVNFGKAQTEKMNAPSMEIERIYVKGKHQGEKIGQLLYEKALSLARLAGVEYVWLGVWEKNEKAIAFYKKNGFLEFGTHDFKLGHDLQTDIMMRVRIVKDRN